MPKGMSRKKHPELYKKAAKASRKAAPKVRVRKVEAGECEIKMAEKVELPPPLFSLYVTVLSDRGEELVCLGAGSWAWLPDPLRLSVVDENGRCVLEVAAPFVKKISRTYEGIRLR